MEDKDVGQLWNEVTHDTGLPTVPMVKQLALKLIQERAQVKGDREACSDFNIPYEEYIAAKR